MVELTSGLDQCWGPAGVHGALHSDGAKNRYSTQATDSYHMLHNNAPTGFIRTIALNSLVRSGNSVHSAAL